MFWIPFEKGESTKERRHPINNLLIFIPISKIMDSFPFIATCALVQTPVVNYGFAWSAAGSRLSITCKTIAGKKAEVAKVTRLATLICKRYDFVPASTWMTIALSCGHVITSQSPSKTTGWQSYCTGKLLISKTLVSISQRRTYLWLPLHPDVLVCFHKARPLQIVVSYSWIRNTNL